VKPTLKDIAEKTGVNISTVSRVLNNSAKISSDVRAKILDAAQELDYYPNHMAQSLMSKRSFNIGLVVPDLSFVFYGFFEDILRGIGLELKKRPYNLLITKFHGFEKNSFFHNARSGIIDGAIILGDALHPTDLKFIRSLKNPYVLINRKFSNQVDNYVYSNNITGGFLATEHLIHHGYKQLVFIGGPKEYSVTTEREKGFMKAIYKHNNLIKDVQVRYAHFSNGLQQGMEALKDVPLQKDKGIGIFAASDNLAYGVIKYLQSQNITVGQEAGVIGYDNQVSNAIISPTLTSIDQNGCSMGERACSLLIDSIEEKECPSYYEIQPELIIRNSCGCSQNTGDEK
jgi:LacI family transcriptional regulator